MAQTFNINDIMSDQSFPAWATEKTLSDIKQILAPSDSDNIEEAAKQIGPPTDPKGFSGQTRKRKKTQDQLTSSTDRVQKGFEQVGRLISKGGGLLDAVGNASGKFSDLNKMLDLFGGFASGLAKLTPVAGDGLGLTVDTYIEFKKILAQYTDQFTSQLMTLQRVGMDGSKSFIDLAVASAEARINMEILTGVLNNNTQAIAQHFGDIDMGAMGILEMQDNLINRAGVPIEKMGIRTEELAEFIGDFFDTRRKTRSTYGKSTLELADEVYGLAQSMRILRELTGIDYDQQMAGMKAVMNDERFAASMRELRRNNQGEFATRIENFVGFLEGNQFDPAMVDIFKQQFSTFGTAVNHEVGILTSLYGDGRLNEIKQKLMSGDYDPTEIFAEFVRGGQLANEMGGLDYLMQFTRADPSNSIAVLAQTFGKFEDFGSDIIEAEKNARTNTKNIVKETKDTINGQFIDTSAEIDRQLKQVQANITKGSEETIKFVADEAVKLAESLQKLAESKNFVEFLENIADTTAIASMPSSWWSKIKNAYKYMNPMAAFIARNKNGKATGGPVVGQGGTINGMNPIQAARSGHKDFYESIGMSLSGDGVTMSAFKGKIGMTQEQMFTLDYLPDMIAAEDYNLFMQQAAQQQGGLGQSNMIQYLSQFDYDKGQELLNQAEIGMQDGSLSKAEVLDLQNRGEIAIAGAKHILGSSFNNEIATTDYSLMIGDSKKSNNLTKMVTEEDREKWQKAEDYANMWGAAIYKAANLWGNKWQEQYLGRPIYGAPLEDLEKASDAFRYSLEFDHDFRLAGDKPWQTSNVYHGDSLGLDLVDEFSKNFRGRELSDQEIQNIHSQVGDSEGADVLAQAKKLGNTINTTLKKIFDSPEYF